jgi:hypothetical protein
MTRNDIKIAILARIDEISPYDSVDVIWDLLMEKTIDDACNNFLMVVPVHLINAGDFSTATFVNNDDGSGYIRLKTDFLRLSSFKMKGWKRPVTFTITQESPRYNLQKNKYTRGGVAKPVVALANKLTANATYLSDVLELFPIYYDWTSNEIEQALYVKKTLPEALQDNLLNGYLWYASAEVLMRMQQIDFAKVAMSKYEEFVKGNRG